MTDVMMPHYSYAFIHASYPIVFDPNILLRRVQPRRSSSDPPGLDGSRVTIRKRHANDKMLLM